LLGILDQKLPTYDEVSMYKHPSLSQLSPNFSRNDLFLVVFCLVDDWMKLRYQSSNAPRKQRGPRPCEFTDSETLTLLIMAELCQCHRERAWLRQVRASYRHLFPALPEDSRFHRRAQRVRHLLRRFRQTILAWADADLEPLRLLDTFPLPLCACYRIRQSTLPLDDASFAYNSSKKLYYYGLHPGLLLTGSGYIDDIILAPGSMADPKILARYLDECHIEGRDISRQDWIMDKGFWSQPLAQAARELFGVNLLARRRDYKDKTGCVPQPSTWQQLIDKTRKPIENVISVLTERFGIEHILARTDVGIYRRTQAKATAFSLARYFNQMLELEPMSVTRYAV
jgi:Transposase DDE domain